MFAAFGSGMSAVCPVHCDVPFAKISFWTLPDTNPVCDAYNTCVNDALEVCKQQPGNDTEIFISAFEAATKVLVNFCRNPDIEDLKGAEEAACDVDKPQKCLMKVDQSQNTTIRCLAVGETNDCLDAFTKGCKAKILRDFVESTKPTFEKIKTECKKMGLSVGDNAASNVQPTVLTLLASAIFVLFRNVLGCGNV